MSEYPQKSSSSAAGLFGGLVVGGLIGATLGILFAPQSGKKTRLQIKNTGEKYYNEGKSKVDKYKKTTIDPKLKNLEKEIKQKVSDVETSVKKVVAEKTQKKK